MSDRFTLAEGGIAGAFAALTFHQSVAALLFGLDLYPVEPFDMAIGRFGVPGVVKSMMWSAGWGVLFLALHRLPRFRRLPLALAGPLYTVTLPIFFLFVPLALWRGAAIAYDMPAELILAVLTAHAAWGFGMALWLAGLRGILWLRR